MNKCFNGIIAKVDMKVTKQCIILQQVKKSNIELNQQQSLVRHHLEYCIEACEKTTLEKKKTDYEVTRQKLYN